MTNEPMDEDELVEGDPAEEDAQAEGGGLAALASSQVPWWVVSVALHALLILLIGLVTAVVRKDDLGDEVVVVTTLEARNELAESERPKVDSKFVLESKHDTPPTDPTSNIASDIVVPPDILAKAELGDHFETINPDRPDTHSAFGNPDAHMFHSVSGSDDAAGGGGTGGASLDDVIGVGASSSPGTGGGWGGGNGTGVGVDNGSGRGSFGQRNGGGRRLMVMRHGGSRGTEGGVESALRWLAMHQEGDGHWDTQKYGASQKTDTACTALALLAFLGAGHTEKVGQWKDKVKLAVSWLKSKQAGNGLVFDTTDAGGHRGIGYPHAIAGMALAEAAGMGRITETVAAAQKAVEYSTEVQQQGEGSDKGAWRYAPKSSPDLSVSGWYVMQLKSAKVAGLHVDPASFDGAIKFLDSVEEKGGGDAGYGSGHRYKYQPSRTPTHRVTAIGCLARQFMGWKKEDLQSGVEWFIQQGGLPEWDGAGGKVDLYYWYYGTLCTFQQGGDTWKRWNDSMKKALCDNQRKGGDENGSWDPVGAYSTEWGRVGQTALGCLCLEVYYRYLPMYKE